MAWYLSIKEAFTPLSRRFMHEASADHTSFFLSKIKMGIELLKLKFAQLQGNVSSIYVYHLPVLSLSGVNYFPL